MERLEVGSLLGSPWFFFFRMIGLFLRILGFCRPQGRGSTSMLVYIYLITLIDGERCTVGDSDGDLRWIVTVKAHCPVST